MKHAIATTHPQSSPPSLATSGLLQRARGRKGWPQDGAAADVSRKREDPTQVNASKVDAIVGVPRIVRDVVDSPGRPLDSSSRTLMEARFGRDFSRVRVHADARAAESAKAVDATAYTVGGTIVFGAGRYAPSTAIGQRLLAHELAHVVQQGVAAVDRPLGIAPPGTALEKQADRIAAAIGRDGLRMHARAVAPAAAELARPPARSVAGWIQRSPLSDAVSHDLGVSPTLVEVLGRLSAADVQGARNDRDVDEVVAGLLGGRPELWVAQRVREGQLGETKGWLGPKAKASPLKPRPIEVSFFRGKSDRRALVIAGVHGTERQGIEVARMLMVDLGKAQTQPFFSVIVVPSLFPDDEAFKSREAPDGTHTNRNFPPPSEDLAVATAAGGGRPVDATTTGGKRKREILRENVMLMELMERFKPERIISIHGTWDPRAAGVFYDPRALRSDETAEAWAEGARAGYSHSMGHVHYTLEGEEQVREELKMRHYERRLGEMRQRASDTDRALSLKAAVHIDDATMGSGLKRGAMKHPAVAGNFSGTTDAPDRASWSGGVDSGTSLGGYAPARGISVFTVEPPINRTSGEYPTADDAKVLKSTAGWNCSPMRTRSEQCSWATRERGGYLSAETSTDPGRIQAHSRPWRGEEQQLQSSNHFSCLHIMSRAIINGV